MLTRSGIRTRLHGDSGVWEWTGIRPKRIIRNSEQEHILSLIHTQKGVYKILGPLVIESCKPACDCEYSQIILRE